MNYLHLLETPTAASAARLAAHRARKAAHDARREPFAVHDYASTLRYKSERGRDAELSVVDLLFAFFLAASVAAGCYLLPINVRLEDN